MQFDISEAYLDFVDLDNVAERKELLRDFRYHIMEGGRGGGKSHFIAELLVVEGFLKPIESSAPDRSRSPLRLLLYSYFLTRSIS